MDSFGTSFNFQLPGGEGELKTVLGAIFSLLLTVVSIFYALLKVNILYTRNDTTYLAYESDSAFGYEPFTSSDGLAIAFAFTSYDDK